ncbi:MAG: sugar ABC transporter permease [Aigarchaeota archaeon]|nr:sugar ABC transporter permease [Candidatus Calditenuaceae archaeon]MDW8022069.1 sugar ABC transporter permease [Nitrososphaerota archaeon]
MREEYKLLLPSVVILAALVAGPTFYLFYTSFLNWFLRDPHGPTFGGLDNYIKLLQSADFSASLIVTLVFSAASVSLSILIGLGLALLFNEELRGKRLMRTVLVMPIVLPPVVVGFTWKFLLSSEVGLIGAYFMRLIGFGDVSLLGEPTLALFSVILADVWGKTPLPFLIFLAGLAAVPPIYYESAKIDGAGKWQTFKSITLPNIRKPLVVALILRTIDAFNSFDVIFVMTKGGPGVATQTLPMLGWKVGFYYFDLGMASAIGVILLVMVISVSMPLVRRISR